MEVRYVTGCDLLGAVVGGGEGQSGFIPGILNIVGDTGTAKSFLACEIVAANYHKYGKKFKWMYDPAEGKIKIDTLSLYGVDIVKKKEDGGVRSKTVEDFHYNYHNFLESLEDDECGIYVLDSLDGINSDAARARMEKKMRLMDKGKKLDKGTFALETPKYLSQEFFKNITSDTEDKGCLLIIISQTRDAINAMFKTQCRAGGKALDFYANYIMWLASMHKIVKNELEIGRVIKAKMTKTRTSRPSRKCMFPVMYEIGVDNIGANVDFLFDLRSVKTGKLEKSSSIVWDGEVNTKIADATVKELTSFLKEVSAYDVYREFLIKNELKSTKKSCLQYIESEKGTAFYDKFEEVFGKQGVSMKRDELILWIEESAERKQELTRRVLEKWEAREKSVLSGRKKKYE
ncbi:MAG: hypothetical protein WC516_06840 [Patescibacteria group bacterium]|jgi:RecA/RadA recombinase